MNMRVETQQLPPDWDNTLALLEAAEVRLSTTASSMLPLRRETEDIRASAREIREAVRALREIRRLDGPHAAWSRFKAAQDALGGGAA